MVTNSYDGHAGPRCDKCDSSLSRNDCDAMWLGLYQHAIESIERSSFGRMRLSK
jgi:hypothetical protein